MGEAKTQEVRTEEEEVTGEGKEDVRREGRHG